MDASNRTRRFFTLAFAITWGLQVPGVLARLGRLPGDPDAYLPFAMLGIFGPTVAALVCTHRESGRAGVRSLLAGLTRVRIAPQWYLAALVLPGALLSAVLFGMNLAGRTGPWSFVPGIDRLVAGVVIAVAEEIGWRGYAMSRLEARYGAFAGNGILGALWAVWHVPMFVAVGVPLSLGLVMLLFFVGGSLYFAWLVRRSGGGVFVAVLAHLGAHLNNSHAVLPADAFPAVVHAVVYAGLGFAVMRAVAPRGTARADLATSR